METVPVSIQPRATISPQCTPAALITVIHNFFARRPDDRVWLVGGTALSGFYAEHRRSDDIDLFAADPDSFEDSRRIILAMDLELRNVAHAATYFHADATHADHQFTIDIVLDEALHAYGAGVQCESGVWIPDFLTLYAMKLARLVSRCSEKDLYDLRWCFEQLGGMNVADMIQRGQAIDAGLTAETLLISLSSAELSQKSCVFTLPGAPGPSQVYREVSQLRDELIAAIRSFENSQPLGVDAQSLAASAAAMREMDLGEEE